MYTWNLKYDTNEPICETETDSWTQRTDWWLPRGLGRDGVGGWGQQMQAFIYGVDKQQGPTGWHREPYLIAYDKQ